MFLSVDNDKAVQLCSADIYTKVNNTLGRREGEAKKEHLVKEYYTTKFNSALVAQGASMLQVFEACMRECASVLKFTFTVAYKVLWNNKISNINCQKFYRAVKNTRTHNCVSQNLDISSQ